MDERARELYLEEWRYLELSRVSYCLALSGKPDEWGNTYDVNTYDKQEGTDPNGGSYWYQRIMHYNEFYNKNPAKGNNHLLNAVLFDIFSCEQDLASHCRVEDYLFVPAVLRLEKEGK